MPEKHDVTKTIQEHLTHHQAASQFYKSNGPRAIALFAAARIMESQAEEMTWRKFELLRNIEDEKLYLEIPKNIISTLVRRAGGAPDGGAEPACHAGFQPCKNMYEACQAFDFSRDAWNLLKKADEIAGRATARQLALLPPADLRAANRLSKDSKKALLDEAKGFVALEAPEAARKLAALVGAFTEQERIAREAAEREAASYHERAIKAEDKARKVGEKLQTESMKLDDASKEVRALKEQLNTPSFARKDKEILDDLRSASITLESLIGNAMIPCDALAARSEKGEPNNELNIIALSLLVHGTRLWGELLARYLPAIDPGQSYTDIWATNALLQSPGAKANLDEYEQAIKSIRKESK